MGIGLQAAALLNLEGGRSDDDNLAGCHEPSVNVLAVLCSAVLGSSNSESMVIEMKVRYGLSESALRLLGGGTFEMPPSLMERGSSKRIREMFAHALSCRIRFCPECGSARMSNGRCRRGDQYLKRAGKCDVINVDPRALIITHGRFYCDVSSSNFRVRRIWVGREGSPHSFVAAQIDVQSHLLQVLRIANQGAPIFRFYALMLVINIVHPFEDGNGRLMRGVALAFCIAYGCDYFAFMGVYMKIMQDQFVHALEMCADGAPEQLCNFNVNAVRKYQELHAEVGGFERWLDECLV